MRVSRNKFSSWKPSMARDVAWKASEPRGSRIAKGGYTDLPASWSRACLRGWTSSRPVAGWDRGWRSSWMVCSGSGWPVWQLETPTSRTYVSFSSTCRSEREVFFLSLSLSFLPHVHRGENRGEDFSNSGVSDKRAKPLRSKRDSRGCCTRSFNGGRERHAILQSILASRSQSHGPWPIRVRILTRSRL